MTETDTETQTDPPPLRLMNLNVQTPTQTLLDDTSVTIPGGKITVIVGGSARASRCCCGCWRG